MPKKRRTRAARPARRAHDRSRGGNRSDLDATRIGLALERLADPFDEWAREESLDVAFDDLRTPLQFALGGLAALGPVEVTAWDPGRVQAMFEVYLPELSELDADGVSGLATAMNAFAAFLQRTGRWTGTDLQLSACVVVLGQAQDVAERASAAEVVRTATEASDVPAGRELRALDALPVVGRLSTVLEWVGRGRPVTPTGALRLVDTVSVAALLGVRVRRVRTGRNARQQVLDIEADDDAPLVRSMWDVAVLAPTWATLHDAGLIEVGPHHVTPTARAARWWSEDEAARREVRRAAVAAFIAVTLRHRAGQGWYQEQAVGALVAALTGLLGGLAVDLAQLEAAAHGLTGTDEHLVQDLIRRELDGAAAEGLLQPDPLRVPQALVPAVGAGLLRLMEPVSPS